MNRLTAWVIYLLVVAALASCWDRDANAGPKGYVNVQDCIQPDSSDVSIVPLCFGMMIGMSDALYLDKKTCPNISYGQQQAMFEKYARANPEIWDKPYPLSFAVYALGIWACKASKTGTPL